MDYKFLFIQLISVVAWFFIVLSYYRENTNKILVFQIIANLTFCIHYLLLVAFSRFLICGIEALCNFGYYKTDKDKYIYCISIPFRIFGEAFMVKTWIDVLPIIASLIDGYSLTRKKKLVVIGGIITYLIWVIYDLNVMSFTGAIFDGIIVSSNICIIIRMYKKNKTIQN